MFDYIRGSEYQDSFLVHSIEKIGTKQTIARPISSNKFKLANGDITRQNIWIT